jgi:hypothetical protein
MSVQLIILDKRKGYLIIVAFSFSYSYIFWGELKRAMLFLLKARSFLNDGSIAIFPTLFLREY